MDVSTLSGTAMPWGNGVEYLYCGAAVSCGAVPAHAATMIKAANAVQIDSRLRVVICLFSFLMQVMD
jgi:hypothetical protein